MITQSNGLILMLWLLLNLWKHGMVSLVYSLLEVATQKILEFIIVLVEHVRLPGRGGGRRWWVCKACITCPAPQALSVWISPELRLTALLLAGLAWAINHHIVIKHNNFWRSLGTMAFELFLKLIGRSRLVIAIVARLLLPYAEGVGKGLCWACSLVLAGLRTGVRLRLLEDHIVGIVGLFFVAVSVLAVSVDITAWFHRTVHILGF